MLWAFKGFPSVREEKIWENIYELSKARGTFYDDCFLLNDII